MNELLIFVLINIWKVFESFKLSFRVIELQTLEWNIRKSTRCPLRSFKFMATASHSMLASFVFLYFFCFYFMSCFLLYRYVLYLDRSYYQLHLHNLIWHISLRSLLKTNYECFLINLRNSFGISNYLRKFKSKLSENLNWHISMSILIPCSIDIELQVKIWRIS